MTNIILLFALAIVSVGLVELGREIGRFIRLRKIKKKRSDAEKLRKVKDALADAVIKDRESYISNEKPRKWNSFTGYESEKDVINETLERR